MKRVVPSITALWSALQSMRTSLVLLAVLAVSLAVWHAPGWVSAAATPVGQSDDIWQVVEAPALAGKNLRGRAWQLNRAALASVLERAPHEFTKAGETRPVLLPLPQPDGSLLQFQIEASPVMEAKLAAQFPEIKSFRGTAVDAPGVTMRGDWSPLGWHATLLKDGQVTSVAPTEDGTLYLSQAGTQDASSFSCDVLDAPRKRAENASPSVANDAVGNQLLTYKIAIAATYEYCQLYGGSAASTLASINAWLNATNAIYETELSVRLVLVNNNTNVLYSADRGFTATSDPFTEGNKGTMLTEVRNALSANIGVANYQLGHVFSGQNFGGVAYLEAVCDEFTGDGAGALKGGGVSGMPGTPGNSGILKVFAHELGHQFGANHSFNGTASSCGAARRGSAAVEPGSGTTIMSYAGSCTSDNLTFGGEMRFHQNSFTEMRGYIDAYALGCATQTNTGNNPPVVSAGPSYTIPRLTPFTLTANGGDLDAADAANLSYVWEQVDAGGGSYANPPYGDQATDSGATTRPLFRSYAPSNNPARTFPSLTYILNNANTPPATVATGFAAPNDVLQVGESLPSLSRRLIFAVTVRDQRGGVSDDLMQVMTATTGPFQVTAPNTAISWTGGATQSVTWNVNGTQAQAANVRILLSTDGGQSFPTVLVATTPNDGSASITVPNNVQTTQARIKLEAVGNIFFDISDANFSITPGGTCPAVTNLTRAGNPGQSVTLTGINFTGVTAIKFSNNVTASFTINSNTQITATVPNGAVSGPLTLSKAGCGDVTTANFTVCSAGPLSLQIDDGAANVIYTSGVNTSPVYYVNRITPTSYPATLSSVQVYFTSNSNIAVGSPLIIVAGANEDADTNINGTVFQELGATTGTLGQFNTYPVTPLTINAGDFVIGFRFTPTSGKYHLAADTNAVQNRSYVSEGGASFSFLTFNGSNVNLMTRGQYFTGCDVLPAPSPTPCPVVSEFTPTSALVGATVSLTGINLNGVSAVKFSNNVAAQFTIVNNAQINVTVPQGAVSGPLTLSKTGCPDVLTADITVLSCNGFTLSPTNVSAIAAGATGYSVSVTGTAGCAWTAVSNHNWITVTSGANGNGDGTVTFNVAANSGPARTGTMTIAGQTFTVNQDTGCSYSISPTSNNLAIAGGIGTVSVTTPAGCAWTATSNATTWLTITAGASGTGNGTVTYSATANTGPARSGTLTIGGRTFTVNQATGCSFTINPTSNSVASTGGTGSVAVTTTSGCTWTAVSNATSWLTVTSGASGNGNGTVNYSVAANTGAARTGTITIAGQTFTVNQASGCTFSINPTANTSVTASGGTATVSVTAGTGCAWTATVNQNGTGWLSITSGSSGSGNGTVRYSVTANTGPQRTGTLTIAGQTFTVTQASGCAVSISPTNNNVAAAGGTGNVAVTAGTGCAWTAVSNATGWLTVTSGASGSGNGTVGYSAAANTGAARTGTITIGAQTFTVNQAGGCTVSISPASSDVAKTGGTGSVSVTAGTGCTWTAVSNASWLTINGAANGSGNGTVNYTVAANTGAQRSGTLTVGGQTFTVNQANGCSFTISPITQNLNAAGGNGSVTVTAGTGCAWTAVSNDNWLTITAGASGTGNGTATFSAAANVGPARTGTLIVAGQTFTVNQVSGCAFTISPSANNAAASGGTGTVNVTSAQGCAWTATSNAAWLTLNGTVSGNGNGAVNYTVAANTGPQRNGTLTVAGQTFSVTQASGCTFSIAPTSQNLAATGGNGTVNVTTAQGCAWAATSNANWLTITSGANGNGPVNFTAAANTGPARTGTLTVAGQTFTVNQAAGCTFNLTPTANNVAASGGTGTVAVTSAQGCTWMAASNDNWISISAGANGTGNGSVSYSVAANIGPARTGTLTIAGQTFTINQAAGCSSGIAPTANNVAASGGTGTVTVSAVAGCTWMATSNAAWITITSGASGNGPGTVGYSVAANTGQARTGTLTIAGQTFTVTQAGGCVAGIAPASANYAAAGGAGTVSLTMGQGCAWTAASDVNWLTINGVTSGSGNGAVNYLVAVNTGPQRTGTLTVAGQTFTVTQASGCSFTLSPTTQSFVATGGNGSVTVTAGQGCAWTTASSANWLTVTSGAAGNGNGKVNFTVAVNNGAPRTGTLTIAGQTFTVTQEGNCLVTITPTANSFAATGGTGMVNVATAQGCAWTALSQADWLTITGTANGNGNGALSYAVAANNGAARTGTLLVAGQTFTVNQASGCGFVLTPTSQSFAAMGGNGSVNLTTGANCAWTAQSNAAWLTITSGASLPGAGTVKFTVAMNSGAQRTGTLTIAGQSFTVTQAAAGALANVSAASYAPNTLAQESIVAAFGVNLAKGVQSASTVPLPTELQGTYISVRDAAGVERRAPLFFVSPNQVNYQLPPGTAPGTAQITLMSDSGVVALGSLGIANTAPGLFTANANGQGVPAGVVLRVRGTTQTYESLVRYDTATQRFLTAPIDLGPTTDTLILVLYGTGLRHRTALDQVTVRIGTAPNDVSAQVLYAGPAPGFIGLDQLNCTLPRTLLGKGEVNLQLMVDGKAANLVQINVK